MFTVFPSDLTQTCQLSLNQESIKNTKWKLNDDLSVSVPQYFTIITNTFNYALLRFTMLFDLSVLYADIVNFTLISSYHSATEVVNLLNYLFCLIDKLTDKYEAFKVSGAQT